MLVSVLVFALLLPLWLGASAWYQNLLIEGQRAEIRDQVSAHGIALSSAVNRRMARLQGVVAYVRNEADDPLFHTKLEPFVSALMEGSSGVRSLSIVSGDEVEFNYPEGGEPASHLPEGTQSEAFQSGGVSHLIEVANPPGSLAGDVMFVARQNVTVDGQFWGQVDMTVDLNPLLAEAGIQSPDKQLQLALQDEHGNVFFGDPEVFNTSPVVWPIVLPEGPWLLAGTPVGGWTASVAGPVRVLQAVAFLVLSLLVLLAFTVSSRQVQLTRLVAARTADLQEATLALEQRVAERTHQLTRLLAVSADITSELALPKLLQLVLEQLRGTVPCHAASILEMENGELVQVAYQGPELQEAEVGRRFTPDSLGVIWEAISRRQPCIIQDITDDSPTSQAMRGIAESRYGNLSQLPKSWLGVPLQLQDRLIGMVAMQHAGAGYFTEERVQLVMSFANQAAIAIENAHLYEQAQQLAALQERQKLARELHDSVSQALYGIALGARTARRLLDQNPEELVEPLDYVLTLAEAGLSEMRSLIFELRPESLEREGLVAALSKQAAAVRARHQITVVTELDADPALPMKTNEALYRITQEALNNVVKHARAKRVVIRMTQSGGLAKLAIEDDGVGFDPEQAFPGHLGLRSMRERCEQVGARLRVASEPGKGSRVEVEVPLLQ